MLSGAGASVGPMFSHPAPPSVPQQPRDSIVPGAPELDQRWEEAATAWEPELRVRSRQEWAWLRYAWEPLASTDPAPDGALQEDLVLLDGALALLRRFTAAADGETAPGSVAELRTEGGEVPRGALLGDGLAIVLAGVHGQTRTFAQLWSLARPEELGQDPWGQEGAESARTDSAGEEAVRGPLFPLSNDDIAWVVSGSMTAQKDAVWAWLAQLTAPDADPQASAQ